MPGPKTASSTMITMRTSPSTALFLLKKRMSASFQKFCAAKLVSTLISSSLCLRAKSFSAKVCSVYIASTALTMASAVDSPPSRIAFSAI